MKTLSSVTPSAHAVLLGQLLVLQRHLFGALPESAAQVVAGSSRPFTKASHSPRSDTQCLIGDMKMASVTALAEDVQAEASHN